MLRNSILFASLAVLGCAAPSAPFTGSKGSPMGTPMTSSIGAAGGSFTAGALTVTVPSGVFAQATTVTATPINSTVPGKRGQALRLEPEGMTFSQPVTLTFHYEDADLEGTAPEALLIAYQHSSGVWAVPGEVTLDTTARTISVQTTHFSDWAMVAGAQLRPGSASVKVNGTVKLVAKRCFAQPESKVEMELAPLLLGFPCDGDEDVAPLPVATSEWSVNGVAGGSASTGTIAGELSQGTFTAPGTKPSPASVAVSARIDLNKRGKTLVVANVTITDGGAIMKVSGKYAKQGQLLTSFVTADVTDDGFEFEMPFPVKDGDYVPKNLMGATPTRNVKDTRSGCLMPSLSGDWDQLRATNASITGSFLTVSGTFYKPAITLGSGEGNCAVDTKVEPEVTEMSGIQLGLPNEILNSSPPAGPVTVTSEDWTITYAMKQ